MSTSKLLQSISKLPDAPGVYTFKKGREKLYVGRATSLRDRVRSYLRDDVFASRGRRIVDMVAQATDVDYIETDSVLEAVILEANLIKKYSPPYNAEGKDNKSFNHVVITDEEFPRVLLVRGRELEQGKLGLKDPNIKPKYTFGPFPHGVVLKEGLRLIRKIFPYRDAKCNPPRGTSASTQKHKPSSSPRPCFNRQIGLCPGVCTGEANKKEYARTIRHIKMIFDGKKAKLINQLEREMNKYAQTEEFEQASERKRQIYALQHIRDVSLLKNEYRQPKTGMSDNHFRVEAYDVAHLFGTNVVGVMTVIEDGEATKSEYRKFSIKNRPGVNDTASLAEILERRLKHSEWRMPDLIVVDGGRAQLNVAESTLARFGIDIPVVAVVKDERHKPSRFLGERGLIARRKSEILLANAEAHRFAIKYHRQLRSKMQL